MAESNYSSLWKKKGQQGTKVKDKKPGPAGSNDKFKKLANHFKKHHIHGDHPESKKINHQGDFDKPTKIYKSVREAGKQGTTAKGTYPGQTKTVVGKISFVGTGKLNKGQDGISSFITTGEKKGRKYIPHHLNGPVIKNGRHYNIKGRDYSECSSSSGAEFCGD